MNRALNAVYKVAQAVPFMAILLGLSHQGLQLLLGVDFLVGVGLAAYLDLPAPTPPNVTNPAMQGGNAAGGTQP